MTDVETGTRGDLDVFEELISGMDDELICDHTGCNNRAAGLLKCGKCGIGEETECAEHRAEMQSSAMEYPIMSIKFDGTCGHSPFYLACPFNPI